MTGNSRFAVSVHIIAYLAHRQCAAVPSGEIAASVDTNPVVIRRLRSALVQARIVTAQKGATGGFALALPPARISLRGIYRAVEPHPTHGLAHFAPNTQCPVAPKSRPPSKAPSPGRRPAGKPRSPTSPSPRSPNSSARIAPGTRSPERPRRPSLRTVPARSSSPA